MITRLFHAWEHRLVNVTTDRVVRPFEWGLDWIGHHTSSETPYESIREWSQQALEHPDTFFSVDEIDDYKLQDQILTFPSPFQTPHPENNKVYGRYFPSLKNDGKRRAVVVLPQWNADSNGHIGLSKLIAQFGISALRLSLPYHDQRMPPELHRADYIVSANIGRTLQVCRQAVLDARRAVHWLSQQGYEKIGILGTSLGSCLAMLTAAHEPKIVTAALNHISPYFADVVWEGLATCHVRSGLEGNIELDQLRQLWLPISPQPYISQMHGKTSLLVYARYDLTFPVRLSKKLVQTFQTQQIPHQVFTLPCGHYSTGIAPFSWLDGYALVKFLRNHL